MKQYTDEELQNMTEEELERAGYRIDKNYRLIRITKVSQLNAAEEKFRSHDYVEAYAWANQTSYQEIAENIIIDRKGRWATPVYLAIYTMHPTFGLENLCKKADEYFKDYKKSHDVDMLSISTHMENNKIQMVVLMRVYEERFSFPMDFFRIFDEKPIEYVSTKVEKVKGHLIVPDEIRNFHVTPKEQEEHKEAFEKQEKIFDSCSEEHPFLNSIDTYIPKKIPSPADNIDMIYDLKTIDMRTQTRLPYDKFQRIFEDVMNLVSGTEYYTYVNVMTGEKKEEEFMEYLKNHIVNTYVNPVNGITPSAGRLPEEDLEPMMKKIYRALFQLYVVQDLIDDPEVTDIKITAPDCIRARVKGKAYLSNVHFINEKDYKRFVNGIAIRNGILQNRPEQTFTDTHDKNYILRFSITAEYVNSVPWPYLHIRKVSRKKLLGDDLIKAGMFDEKIRDYLLDCGKYSRGVVFAGPPGSGKTVALNWFLEEAYEQSAEILVIQENDELFAYRKGVMFQHVVNYSTDQRQAVSLEELGKLALVAGANVFIIGEAKGAEICSAITLSNSGCRTAITIHSPSSTETIDKMADLAMRGYAQSYDQAKRMLKSFQTIVYLEDFKVKEISEITGYDEKKHDMTYRYIYRRPEAEE